MSLFTEVSLFLFLSDFGLGLGLLGPKALTAAGEAGEETLTPDFRHNSLIIQLDAGHNSTMKIMVFGSHSPQATRDQ